MDYKFTFEDGSEAFAHYGVKGMKWRKHKAQDSDEDQQGAEGLNPLAALQSGFSNAKRFASSKLTEAGKAVENGKK